MSPPGVKWISPEDAAGVRVSGSSGNRDGRALTCRLTPRSGPNQGAVGLVAVQTWRDRSSHSRLVTAACRGNCTTSSAEIVRGSRSSGATAVQAAWTGRAIAQMPRFVCRSGLCGRCRGQSANGAMLPAKCRPPRLKDALPGSINCHADGAWSGPTNGAVRRRPSVAAPPSVLRVRLRGRGRRELGTVRRQTERYRGSGGISLATVRSGSTTRGVISSAQYRANSPGHGTEAESRCESNATAHADCRDVTFVVLGDGLGLGRSVPTTNEGGHQWPLLRRRSMACLPPSVALATSPIR